MTAIPRVRLPQDGADIGNGKTFCRPSAWAHPFFSLFQPHPSAWARPFTPEKKGADGKTHPIFSVSLPPLTRSQIRLPTVARPSLSAAPRALRKPKTVRDERWRVSERRPSPCAARLLVGGRQMGTGIVNLFSIY